MADLFILLVLFIGAYSGYKKGVILQLIQTIGYAAVILFALDYYILVSDYLYLLVPYPTPFAPESNPYLFYDSSFIFSMDMSYYHLVSFLAILFVGWVVVRFLTKLASYTLEKLRAPEPISGIGGGILGFFVNYIGLFFILLLLTTIPYEAVQTNLIDSPLASTVIQSTPGLSDRAYQRFFADVHEETTENLPILEIPSMAEEDSEETVDDNQE